MFSSGPGPREGYSFGGVQTKGVHAFVPFMGEMKWGVNALQLDNYITYGLSCDTAYMRDPSRFLQILD